MPASQSQDKTLSPRRQPTWAPPLHLFSWQGFIASNIFHACAVFYSIHLPVNSDLLPSPAEDNHPHSMMLPAPRITTGMVCIS
ncbi:hypothetical protein ATANTOWER_020195 [Ataeniobius toweri]|uniref:Uncharacterized protein n=1 Tax=Ataeniobius toweri TaxID=208326 RepID=A0ABU7AYU3_9TELE|nr:hypothetical protein [Ataeniobius toweri]